jgi:hypothetical protein
MTIVTIEKDKVAEKMAMRHFPHFIHKFIKLFVNFFMNFLKNYLEKLALSIFPKLP